MAFVLNLQDITAHSPCSLKAFADKAELGKSCIEYPNGWTEAESTRVATENPVPFLWLVSKRLIPVSFTEARAVMVQIHGAEATKKICEAFVAAAQPA